jgi:hypothetical protein
VFQVIFILKDEFLSGDDLKNADSKHNKQKQMEEVKVIRTFQNCVFMKKRRMGHFFKSSNHEQIDNETSKKANHRTEIMKHVFEKTSYISCLYLSLRQKEYELTPLIRTSATGRSDKVLKSFRLNTPSNTPVYSVKAKFKF